MPSRISTILACALLAGCSAMDASESGTVMLRGKIDPAMADKVEASLATGQRQFIIDSPGGYVLPAARMAKAIMLANATVTARGQCRSACSMVLMAAAEKRVTPGTIVSLHDSAVVPAYATFLALRGVPADIIAAHAGAINDRPLSQAELARMGLYPETKGQWHR